MNEYNNSNNVNVPIKLNKRTMFSLGLLASFFLPWLNFIIFNLSGFRIPIAYDRLSSIGSLFGNDMLYVKLSYLLYLIPICAIYNSLVDLKLLGDRKKFFLNEFVVGLVITGAIFIIAMTSEFNLAFLGIGFWLTVLFSILGVALDRHRLQKDWAVAVNSQGYNIEEEIRKKRQEEQEQYQEKKQGQTREEKQIKRKKIGFIAGHSVLLLALFTFLIYNNTHLFRWQIEEPFSFGRMSSFAEPNEQRIMQDLVGRTISEPTRRLHRSSFQVRTTNNVQSVDILDTERTGNQIRYTTHLILHDGINTYVSELIITYALNNNEWAIQHIEPRFLDIVPTGIFCNCIVFVRGTGWNSYSIFMYNNCDVTLVVEGR